jgi:hypothetical protein
MEFQPVDPPDDRIEQMTGRHFEPDILPVLFPSAHQIISASGELDEFRNFGGIVLQISIHRHDVFTGTVSESRIQGSGFPAMGPELNAVYPGIALYELQNFGPGLVPRSVVHEKHLHPFGELVQNIFQFGIQRSDV